MTSPTVRISIPEGVLIRDPESGRVARTGEEYPRAGFWDRRLAAGEVSELARTPDEPTAAAATREL